MVRRFLCLGVILLLIVLSVPSCSDNGKRTGPAVTDPDGNYVPKPAGGKAG
jgi:hypothetical protein